LSKLLSKKHLKLQNNLKMKKITISSALIFMAMFSHAQTDFSWIKPGLKIRYYLHEYSSNYEFVVELLDIGKAKKFNWWMTWPVNRKGTCLTTEYAMQNATKQQNYFRGGYEEQNDRTTGFVSYPVWKAMKDKGSITIQPVDDEEVLKYVCDYPYTIVIDGKSMIVPTFYCETDLGSKYWILDNPENPIILKMVLDFNIEIGEILTPEYWEN